MLSDQKLDISDLEGSGITVQRGADGGAFIDTMDREGAQRQADAQAELQVDTNFTEDMLQIQCMTPLLHHSNRSLRKDSTYLLAIAVMVNIEILRKLSLKSSGSCPLIMLISMATPFYTLLCKMVANGSLSCCYVGVSTKTD